MGEDLALSAVFHRKLHNCFRDMNIINSTLYQTAMQLLSNIHICDIIVLVLWSKSKLIIQIVLDPGLCFENHNH